MNLLLPDTHIQDFLQKSKKNSHSSPLSRLPIAKFLQNYSVNLLQK